MKTLTPQQVDSWKQLIREALADAGALPLDVQQLNAIVDKVIPSAMRYNDYNVSFLKTFAALAQAELDKNTP